MKFIYLLIIPLFLLLSCKNSGNENEPTDTVTTNVESTEDVQSDVVEDEIVDSDLDFYSEPCDVIVADYDFGYVKDEKIYFYNTETNKKVEIPCKERVFNFTFYANEDYIYYLAYGSEGTLSLYYAEFDGENIMVSFEVNTDEADSFFLTETYGEKALIDGYDGMIVVECNYEWDSFCFMSSLEYEKNSGDLFYNEEGAYFDLHIECSEGLTYDENNDLMNDSIRLTDVAQYYDPDDEYAMNEIGNYCLSYDNTKVFYNVITGMGDLAHGPGFVVNMDGTNKVQLMDDIISMNLQPKWLYTEDAQLIFIDDDLNLCLLSGDDNSIEEIDNSVDYYSVVGNY